MVAPEPVTPRARVRDNQVAVLTADPVLLASPGGPWTEARAFGRVSRSVSVVSVAGEYGTNVWATELPEVWEGVRGRRLIREEGRPLSGAVWELPAGSRGVDYVMLAAHASPGIVEYPDKEEYACR